MAREGYKKCPFCAEEIKEEAIKCRYCNSMLIDTEGRPFSKATLGEERLIGQLTKFIPKELARKILDSREQIEGERKNVTVVFADISGFTAMSELLDPEEVFAIMNDCFKVLVNVIYKYEGTIDKFIGDEIMVLFGAPVAHEDDPERAFRASLEMMEKLEEYNNGLGKAEGLPPIFLHHRLRMHIGINSGMVIAGNVGADLRMSYSVVGDTVNLAKRLVDAAEPGQVLVSEDTYNQTKRIFDFRRLEPIRAEGKREPIQVYEVVGIRRERVRLRGLEGAEQVRLVGREGEFQRLKACVERVAEGRGQVVSIVGEAGIGKTRLNQELVEYVLKRGFNYLEGRCFSYGTSISYLPFIEIIKSICGIDERDTEVVIGEKITWAMNSLGLSRRAPFIGNLLSVDLGGEGLSELSNEKRREMTMEAVRSLLFRMAEEKPLLLIVEDLHWIDKASKDFLREVIGEMEEVPLLICGLYRSNYRPDWVEQPCHQEIRLERFSEVECWSFIQSLLKMENVPEKLSEMIIRKTEGNPFYIEEVICSLIDDKTLLREDQGWKLAKEPQEVDIPDTVQGVIVSRIDSLDESAKRVLLEASVIGRSFYYDLLREILRDREKLIPSLTRLESLGFISRGPSQTDREYIFEHVLTQEAAYSMLLLKKRRDLHRRVSWAIERLYGERLEEYYELLVLHCQKGEMREKLLFYLIKAGEKTKRLYENDSAIDYFRRALEILDEFEGDEENIREKIECLSNLGDVLILVGKYEEAMPKYQLSLDLANRIDDRSGQAKAYQNIGEIQSRTGDYSKALEFDRRALGLMKETGDKSGEASVLNDMGTNYCWMGEYHRALQFFQRSLRIRREIKERHREAFCSMNIGAIYGVLGDQAKALEFLEPSLPVFQETDDREMEARVLANISSIKKDLGEYQDAKAYGLKALNIVEEIGDREAEISILATLGEIHSRLGGYPDALKYFSRSLHISREIGDVAMEAASLSNIGSVHWRLGDYKEALRFYRESLKVGESSQAKDVEAETLNNMGRIYRTMGDHTSALKSLRKAYRIALEINHKSIEASAQIDLGCHFFNVGEYQKSLDYLHRGQKVAREAGYKELEIYALVGLGRTYRELNDLQEALKAVEEAGRGNEKLRHRGCEIAILKNLGEIRYRLGEYTEALKTYQSLLKLAKRMKNRKEVAWALGHLGFVLQKLGYENQGFQYYQRALQLAREMEDRPLEAEICLGLGEYYFSRNELIPAVESLERSLEISRRIDNRELLWQVHYLLGKIYPLQNRTEEAYLNYRKSVEILESLRATIKEERYREAYVKNSARSQVYSEYAALPDHTDRIERMRLNPIWRR